MNKKAEKDPSIGPWIMKRIQKRILELSPHALRQLLRPAPAAKRLVLPGSERPGTRSSLRQSPSTAPPLPGNFTAQLQRLGFVEGVENRVVKSELHGSPLQAMACVVQPMSIIDIFPLSPVVWATRGQN